MYDKSKSFRGRIKSLNKISAFTVEQEVISDLEKPTDFSKSLFYVSEKLAIR